ncbi:MAG TPA: hydroxymethylbilane synthase [Syntrophales bacterium]|nr:hydroxymethylbilane synthase [Syntrophales bacterium]HOL59424.1 hydroxymethylbilane synthase [Syntrophales bacterium]HPO35581.1 hydroxymethylbilane synthase [Syntrophales bacterium]
MDSLRARYPEIHLEVTIIKTKGDVMQDMSLVQLGGKGVFVKEIEEALMHDAIDLAVHSLKDCPAEIPDALEIAATPRREDPRDVLIARESLKIERLPHGALIGTGSLRRKCQLLHLYPDLKIIPLRGNLDTRIRKILSEGLHGVVVAAAGMKRMGWVNKISCFIPPELMIPAVGQGILALEIRKKDEKLKELLSFINDHPTWIEAASERAFLRRIGGGCRLPLGAHAVVTGNTLTLNGFIGTPNGRALFRNEFRGSVREAEEIGVALAEDILARGGRAIVEKMFR